MVILTSSFWFLGDGIRGCMAREFSWGLATYAAAVVVSLRVLGELGEAMLQAIRFVT